MDSESYCPDEKKRHNRILYAMVKTPWPQEGHGCVYRGRQKIEGSQNQTQSQLCC
jgi:hypothetical protein